MSRWRRLREEDNWRRLREHWDIARTESWTYSSVRREYAATGVTFADGRVWARAWVDLYGATLCNPDTGEEERATATLEASQLLTHSRGGARPSLS